MTGDLHRWRSASSADLLDLIDDTHRAAQLPIEAWYGRIGEPIVGDAVIDRLVSGAHLIKLRGESMRKTRARAK
jgi:DNA replication protein DnaC